MTGWIVFGSILLFFVVLFSLSIVVWVDYDGEELKLFVGAGFLRFPLYPPKVVDEAKKAGKKTTKAAKKEQKAIAEKEKKPKKGDLQETIFLVRDLLEACLPPMGKMLGAMRIRRLRLRLIVGGDDAAEVAQDYGLLSAIVYTSLGALSKMISVRTKKIHISCNFLQPKTTQELSFVLKLRIGTVLGQAARMGIRILVHTYKRAKNSESPPVPIKTKN